MLESVRSLTTLFDQPVPLPPAAFHLLIMGPDLFLAQALPKSGSLSIGRADNADIRITDPLASRLHARLHVTAGMFEIEDIGSINRTKVRDVALEHSERVAVLPGEAVTIGSTILMVQETRVSARNRRVWPHTHFEARIEEECARAAEMRTPFAIIRLAVEGHQPAGTVADTISPALRTSDMLALYGPSDYEIFLPATPPDLGSAINRNLIERLRAQSIVARTGIACHPRDGQTPEALVARSSERLRGLEAPPPPVDGVVVEDPRMRRVYGLATSAAKGTISVIILGETGVGKDVMAQEIHRRSPRAKAPFVAINCAAVSEGLLESELFGHEKGAFTGANEAKAGLLETAPGGTVFLDEIGDMPPKLQATLLRVIQTRQVQRVGSVKTRPIDVRFIAATHRDVEAEIAAGRFRQDLYYRLNGITLLIPPLRERRSEILPLVRSFLAQFAREMGDKPAPEISPEAARLLEAYSWRGNVREVRNIAERALLLCEGHEILPEHLPIESMAANALSFASAPPPEPQALPPAATPVEMARPTAPQGAVEDERERILRVLAECAGSQTRAAKLLGMARSTLIARLDEYGVPRPRK